MADVAANLKDWSTTASSNSPTDATTIGSGLADNLQEIQKVVRQDLAHKGTDIASSAAPDVGAVAGLYHDVTGSNTIVGLGSTATAGIWRILQFDASPPLVHSTALQLIGGATIVPDAGDVGIFFCEATNQWRMVSYFRADIPPSSTATASVAGIAELATNAETLTGTDTQRVPPVSALESVLGLKKLSSGSVASSTAVADVTMTAFTSYANKMLVYRNFLPATDNVSFSLRTSTDGGATFDAGASDYDYVFVGRDSSGATATGNSQAASSIQLNGQSIDNATVSGGVSGVIEFFGMTNTLGKAQILFRTSNWNSDSTSHVFVQGGAGRDAAGDVDAVRFLFTSGNIVSGNWTLYAIV